MILAAAFLALCAAGLWLIGVGIYMAIRPHGALRILALTASTRTINNIEQGLRLAAGAALVIRSPVSKTPWLFEFGGWFIIASSLVLLLVPLRWHSAYAMWWARRLRPWTVRLVAPLSCVAGIALIHAAI